MPIAKVESNPHRAFQVNIEGTANLLEVIRVFSQDVSALPWIFIASSSHVYAPSEQELIESSIKEPVTLYGQTKLLAEQWALAYKKNYNLPICIGRIFSFSSKFQESSYFFPTMIHKIKSSNFNETLKIPGVLGKRSFLTTRQIIQIIKILYEKKQLGPINICSKNPCVLLDLIEDIKNYFARSDIKIEPENFGHFNLIGSSNALEEIGCSQNFIVKDLLDEFLKEN